MDQLISQLETALQTSLLLSSIIAYAGGVLTSLTPCVYPMIPVTAGIVGHSNIGGSKKRGFLLSLTYVCGMAIAYAGLGVFAAATGHFFGAINSNPLTYLIIGNCMLVFALAMLDVFALPSFSHRLTTKKAGLTGVFVAGILSAFIAGPCTAPVLGVLLAYVATSGALLLGGLMLFLFSFGMGTILIAVGTFSGFLTALPRSGNWMTRIKQGMGFFMIILAEYFFYKAGTFII
ncbi:MAG: cytochrome C biogenesis protein [Desulfobulbus propionicus]|nr:MAG: cytochrome C biogenesis protein [Desulfobulbus propionicus]